MVFSFQGTSLSPLRLIEIPSWRLQSFIAEVIFRVLFTEAILPFTSFSDAMTIRSL